MDSKSLNTSRRNSKSRSRNRSQRSSRSSNHSKSSKRSSSKKSSRNSSKSSKSSRNSSKSSKRSSSKKSKKSKSLNSDLSKKCSKSNKCAKKAFKEARREARKEAFEHHFDILERSDGFGAMIVYCFQLIHLIYCVCAILFYSFFDKVSTGSLEWNTILNVTVIETFSMCMVLLVLFYRTPGFRCLVLLAQYSLVFFCFSKFFMVLKDDEFTDGRTLCQHYFGPATVYALSGFVHGMILMFALDFIGSAKMDDDFADKYIIETRKKRKHKLYLMMAELLKAAVLTQPSSNVGVIVTDETGLPVKIDGSVLKSDVERKISLTLGNDSMKLDSTSMVESTLSVPSEKVAPVQTVKIIKKNEPVYNHCTEQKNYFSPRVL